MYKAIIKGGIHAGSNVAIKIIDLEKYDNESIVDIKVIDFPERDIHYEFVRSQERDKILRVFPSWSDCVVSNANI